MAKPAGNKKGAKKVTKKIAKKAGPRPTRTIKAAVAEAQATTQPSAGQRKLPRQNRRNKQSAQKAKGKKAASKK